MLRWRLAILVLALASLAVPSPAVSKDGPETSRQQMLKLVAEPLLDDALAKRPASFYGPDNLYEYMDGAADIFVLYGVRQMVHVDLRAKAAEITLDVFDMGSPDAAFGMYAAERSPDFQYIAIGAEGYEYEGMLNFLQDRYYVKLLGFGDGANAMLAKLARELSARIGTNSTFPALLSKLPAEHRKPHSEQYIPANALGHPFLAPAYMVAYAHGDQESKLLVTVARDEADAGQRLKQLELHFKKTGQCEPAPDFGAEAVRGSNSFEGNAIAEAKGRYLILLLNPGKDSEQLLRNVATSLQ